MSSSIRHARPLSRVAMAALVLEILLSIGALAEALS